MFKDTEEYYKQKVLLDDYSDSKINLLIGQIVSQDESELLKNVRDHYRDWEQNLILIENYFITQLREIVEQVSENVDDISPISRYYIVLSMAKKMPNAEFENILKKYVKKTKDNFNLTSLQKRALIIIKGMHRSAMIYGLQWSDRIIEESKIIKHKFDIGNKDLLRAHYQSILLVHDTLRMYINQVEHVERISGGFEDIAVVSREMPSTEVFEDLTSATIELFKLEGIFVPVVIKTLKDQENPYQLIIYAKDLLILYGLLQEKGAQLSEKQIRDRVAEEVRNDDLMDRFHNWLITMSEYNVKNNELNTPFAKKITNSLPSLGSGKIIEALKSRVSLLSDSQKTRAKYAISLVFSESKQAIGGLYIGNWFLFISSLKNQLGNNINQLVLEMRKRGILASEISEKDLFKIKELYQIIVFVEGL